MAKTTLNVQEAKLLSNILATCATTVIHKVILVAKAGATFELSSSQSWDPPYEHPVHITFTDTKEQ